MFDSPKNIWFHSNVNSLSVNKSNINLIKFAPNVHNMNTIIKMEFQCSD